jgi:hypothetical protein
MIYPYNSAIILTDKLFSDYGGDSTLATNFQRSAAYFIAEMQVSEELETYLLPTIVTGTYLYNPKEEFLTLENTYVTRIIKTSFLDTKEHIYWSQTGTDNIYISLRDGERGLVDIHYLVSRCNCTSIYAYPYQVQEIYQCGLTSGTTYRPDIMTALTTYADIILNELVGYGNESSGDIGVQAFNNQGYSESRIGLIRTAFGSSARAQFIKKLLTKHRRSRYIRLGT